MSAMQTSWREMCLTLPRGELACQLVTVAVPARVVCRLDVLSRVFVLVDSRIIV